MRVLVPVHTGRRLRRQIVTENGDCGRKRRQSPFSATVAIFGDSIDRAKLEVAFVTALLIFPDAILFNRFDLYVCTLQS